MPFTKKEHTLFYRQPYFSKGRDDTFYHPAIEVGGVLLPLGVWLNELHPIEGPMLSRRPRARFFKAIVGRTEVIPFPTNFFA